MAISYQFYGIVDDAGFLVDGEAMLTALKQAIDSTEIFTSSEITTEYETKTLTVVKDSVTHLTVRYYFSSPEIEVVFRQDSGAESLDMPCDPTELYGMYVGTSGNSVIFSLRSPLLLWSIVITPGLDGNFIIASDRFGRPSDVYPVNIKIISEDNTSEYVYTDDFQPYRNSKWTTLIGLAAHSTSSNYVRTGFVYRMFTVQNGIPSINSGDCGYRKLTIDGKTYLTDGYFCLLDK